MVDFTSSEILESKSIMLLLLVCAKTMTRSTQQVVENPIPIIQPNDKNRLIPMVTNHGRRQSLLGSYGVDC